MFMVALAVFAVLAILGGLAFTGSRLFIPVILVFSVGVIGTCIAALVIWGH